jgi:hypothetical protein
MRTNYDWDKSMVRHWVEVGIDIRQPVTALMPKQVYSDLSIRGVRVTLTDVYEVIRKMSIPREYAAIKEGR